MTEAVDDLQAAARVPLFRFTAAAQLGRLLLGRATSRRASIGSSARQRRLAPTPEEGFALLYDLADTLDRLGESARALAVLMELDADAAGYRDVRSASPSSRARRQGAAAREPLLLVAFFLEIGFVLIVVPGRHSGIATISPNRCR